MKASWFERENIEGATNRVNNKIPSAIKKVNAAISSTIINTISQMENKLLIELRGIQTSLASLRKVTENHFNEILSLRNQNNLILKMMTQVHASSLSKPSLNENQNEFILDGKQNEKEKEDEKGFHLVTMDKFESNCSKE